MTPRRLLKLATNAVVGLFALSALALLVGMVLIPLVTGWVPLTILSGSMTPTYKVGNQVYVDRIDTKEEFDALRPGDVISFMPKPNDTTMVTHRIVGVDARGDGTRAYVTKGDANNAPDSWRVEQKMARGKVKYTIPYAGYIALYLDGDTKKTGVFAIATLLFAYAGWQALGALRARRRHRAREKRSQEEARVS